MGTKSQWDEGGGRVLLGDNTGGRAVILRPMYVAYISVYIWPYVNSIRTWARPFGA